MTLFRWHDRVEGIKPLITPSTVLNSRCECYASQVRHSGTLMSTLVGSSRRVTLREVEALVAEKRDQNASPEAELYWDIDTGGKLLVRKRWFVGSFIIMPFLCCYVPPGQGLCIHKKELYGQ